MKDKFLKNLTKEIAIDLGQQFDRNFERKGFFNEKWQKASYPATLGSLMLRRGTLRRSIKAQVQGSKIVFSSHLPQTKLHNQGGEIKVTPKMKGFFFYKAKEAKNANIRNFYTAMALKKEGSAITIPKRQFIGNHFVIEKSVKNIVGKQIGREIANIQQNFK